MDPVSVQSLPFPTFVFACLIVRHVQLSTTVLSDYSQGLEEESLTADDTIEERIHQLENLQARLERGRKLLSATQVLQDLKAGHDSQIMKDEMMGLVQNCMHTSEDLLRMVEEWKRVRRDRSLEKMVPLLFSNRRMAGNLVSSLESHRTILATRIFPGISSNNPCDKNFPWNQGRRKTRLLRPIA